MGSLHISRVAAASEEISPDRQNWLVNPEKEHVAASCDHLAVTDSEIVSSDDDGVALVVKGVGGVGDVALDLHCHSCI